MKTRFAKTLLPAAGISILAASPCLSQGAIVPSPNFPLPQIESKAPRKRMHQIRLSYVRPSVMAWWLDPKNHAEPHQIGQNDAAQGRQFHLKFTLPAGIDRIVAIDPQNALLVFGTDEGVQEIRDTVQFLDRPGDKIPLRLPNNQQIVVGARLLTIETANLSGIWTALATQTGRATPAMAFLKPEEELALGEQIAQRQARFERVENLSLSNGAKGLLDFGPAYTGRSNREMFKDFHSEMPVIPPPETGDMRNPLRGRTGRLLPSPLGDLKLQITPTLQADNSTSLEVRELEPSGILGRAPSARFDLRTGDTLALALPDSTPGTSAFLLLTARSSFQYAPLYRTPNLDDLPIIGGLFRTLPTPQKTP